MHPTMLNAIPRPTEAERVERGNPADEMLHPPPER
jgi:hypothetical protein